MRRFVPPVLRRSTCASRLALGFAIAVGLALTTIHAQVPGRNVNMVSGADWPEGDPFLQRQNEPSIAASTRNPLHLLGGSNDYRTVDLPGLPDGVETGDAWLGLFKSTDGGQRWTSTLLPGYPQDASPAGLASPLKAYQAGADAVVRAGTNGLFYYSGLAFDRGENGKSGIFVSRFIDNNNQEAGDPVAHLGTVMVAKSTPGKFLDKPWMAVDIPRANAPTCTITADQIIETSPRPRPRWRRRGSRPGATPPGAQRLKAGAVYVAYSSISGEGDALRSEIFLTRSIDCGTTWSDPIRVSNASDPVNQGASLALDPRDGSVFVAWRRFATDATPNSDGVMLARLPFGAKRFDPPSCAYSFPRRNGQRVGRRLDRIFEHGRVKARPSEAAGIAEFDQGTSPYSFRSNAYPAMAVDDTGRVYLAWSERGFATGRPAAADGDARIVMTTSRNGTAFRAPFVVDDDAQLGHQLMPTMAFAGGKLMLVYYDLRETRAQTFGPYVSDQVSANGKRQTIDIRASLGTPGAAPQFAPSVKVSDYLMGYRAGRGLLEQLQINPPNLPMFKQGTVPFMGDYIDVAAAPAFVPAANGKWAYNTAATSAAPVFHAAWTDNRDVRAPLDGNWANYTPATSAVVTGVSRFDPTQNVPVCMPGNAGSRNQNIYTARITGGLLAGSPGNSKPLSPTLPRGFVVFAQNGTAVTRSFRMTVLNQPPGGRASFEQFPLPPYSAASPPALTVIDMRVPPRSTASRTVYVTSANADGQVSVDVSEIDAIGAPGTTAGGLNGKVVLNPDIENPDIENPDIENPDIENPDIENAEIATPDIENPDIENPDIENPDIENPDIENPDIENVVVANPDIENLSIGNPDIENPDIENPDIENPDIENPDIENGSITDLTWNVTNNGNTTAAFNVNLFLSQTAVPQGLQTQLVLYKTYRTPVTVPNGCDLRFETRNVLMTSIANPSLITVTNNTVPDQNDPSEKNATLWLEPGEAGRITLRVVDPDRSDNDIIINEKGEPVSVPRAFNPEATPITPGVSSQAVPSESAEGGETEPPIVTPGGSNLFFLQLPVNAAPGTAIAPAVRVRVFDNAGSVLPGVVVTLSLGNNTTGATLSGGVATTGLDGVAVFPALQVSVAGTDYVLIASVSGAVPASATSTPFDVGVPPPFSPDLSVSQVHTPAIVNLPFTYTVTVTNNGPVVATDVVLTDILPAGVTFVGVGDDICQYADGIVTCPVGVLASGESQSFTIDVTPTTSAAITNTVTVIGGQSDPDLGNNSASDVAFVSTYAPCVSPTFAGPTSFALGTANVGIIATGDFNEDGVADVAITDGLDQVSISLGTGVGGFNPPAYVGVPAPVVITAGDFNEDDHVDLAVGTINPPMVTVLFGDGAGNFVAGTPLLIPLSSMFSLEKADLNADQHLDLAISSASTADSSIVVLLGDGQGEFGVAQVAAGPTPGNVVIDDFDRNETLDIAVNNINAPTVSVLNGDGAGGFSAPVTVALPSSTVRLRRLDDVNGDGRPDLGVTTSPAAGVPANLMLLANDGAGGFFPAIEIIGPVGIGFTMPGDFNGDGKPDLAGISFQTNSLVIALGDGAGGFTQSASYLTGTSQNHLAVVDVNLDGKPDIVGTRRGDFYVLLNICAGGNGASADLAAALAGPAVATVGDLLTLSATVTNNGPDAATNAVATLVVPTGMNFISSTEACVDASGTLSCSLPDLPANGSVSFGVTVQAFAAGVRVNRVMVTALQPDADASTNVAAVSTTVAAGAFSFVVSNTNDAGPGSLRQAMTDANLNIGSTNEIRFNLTGAAPFTIAPLSALPPVTVPVIIDGTTQPGFSGTPVVELNGANAGVVNGLNIIAGGSTVRGLVINRWNSNGIFIQTNGNNLVEGSYLGTNVAGTVALPNVFNGIRIQSSNNNVIGGSTSAARNVISGNGAEGVVVAGTSTGNSIRGNYIGADVTGSAIVANRVGVALNPTSTNTTIGGSTPGAGNVISGNGVTGQYGVGVSVGQGSSSNIIQGNFIGTNAAGSAALPNADGGIEMVDSNGNLIGGTTVAARNIISGNGSSAGLATNIAQGIGLFGTASGNVIQGNFVGTDVTGTVAIPNVDGGITANGFGNTIGGTAAGAGNLISGNGTPTVYAIGISVGVGDGNLVVGNRIGTNAAGTAALGNTGDAIRITNSNNNTIGGTAANAGNLLSGNGAPGLFASGVALFGTSAGNAIQGNLIGTDLTATLPIGNNDDGVFVNVTGTSNTIGGTAGGAANVIAFNAFNGVGIAAGTGVAVRGNAVFSNGRGIDLGRNGVTANDSGDPDAGPNNYQNFPVITQARGDAVDGTLNSAANTTFTVDLFASATCDASGFGEGQRYLGFGLVSTGPDGNGAFQIPVTTAVGEVVTATATDPAGNTSEFSSCVAVALPFVVTNVNDAGAGSLRQAILNANATPALDTIQFDIAGSAPFMIALTTFLPTITAPVIIDASTQPGYAGTPIVEIDGVNTGTSSNGLYLDTNDSTIRGLSISRFGIAGSGFGGGGIVITGSRNRVESNYVGIRPDGTTGAGNRSDGIFVRGSDNVITNSTVSGNGRNGITITDATSTGNLVLGSRIGTNAAGTAAVPNVVDGINIFAAPDNVVGGTGLAEGNVISGNGTLTSLGYGVNISGSSVEVMHNRIGTNAAGTAAIPNSGGGINITGSNNLIGGPSIEQRNVISGNGIGFPFSAAGVRIAAGPAGNLILGNYIGVDAGGTAALGNTGSGITIQGSTSVVGGVVAAASNVIAFNSLSGVRVLSGTANQIGRNEIFANGLLGIDLGGDGVTANDAGDADAGANGLQNVPVIAQASANTVDGSLNSTASSTFMLHFFASATCDSSGFGEGQRYLGSSSVVTDASGNGTFQGFVPAIVGEFITATATDPAGSTSEFSSCVAVTP